MYNNPVIFIDVFITTQSSENMFLENLKQFKKLNLPIFIITNSKRLSSEVVDVDYVFYDKEDLKFKNIYDNYMVTPHFYGNSQFIISSNRKYKQLYGLSVLSNLYKGFSILKSLNYECVLKLEWDYFFNDYSIDGIKEFVNDFIKSNYKAKIIQVIDGCIMSPISNIFGVEFFLNNFPKILNERDYEQFIIKEFGNRDFKVVENIVHHCLVSPFTNSDIIHSVQSIKVSDVIGNQRINLTNISSFSTSQSIKVFAKLTGDVNKYFIFFENINYINKENPNWMSIECDIKTKTNHHHHTCRINTECWHFDQLVIPDDEFPIVVTVDGILEVYNTPLEVTETCTYQ